MTNKEALIKLNDLYGDVHYYLNTKRAASRDKLLPTCMNLNSFFSVVIHNEVISFIADAVKEKMEREREFNHILFRRF